MFMCVYELFDMCVTVCCMWVCVWYMHEYIWDLWICVWTYVSVCVCEVFIECVCVFMFDVRVYVCEYDMCGEKE